jgi:tetratricopeptide (TPR) repeat protein
MSRSLHTTRRQLYELRRAQFASAAEQQQRLDHARQLLVRKRTVKEQVRRRRVSYYRPDAPAGTASIPVEVRDQHAADVHYPACTEDVRAVLELLPPGTLDGVSRVVLCLGAEYQRDLVEARREYGEPDPLLGRFGFASLPGVYVGVELGTYFPHDASIWLYAYVYQADVMPERDLRELYLRLLMLVTLLHEVAHHWDGSGCDLRGRWVDRPEAKSEWSARKRAYQWTQQLVIPYLEQRYPAAAQALVAWVDQHGGVALPLSGLVNQPEETMFSTAGAVEALFSAHDRGLSAYEVRVDFACELYYAERYDAALQSIATLLTEHPGDIPARTLQADIYAHQERYEEAEQVARTIVAEEPTYADAWDVLVNTYRAQGRWHELVAAATQAIKLSQAGGWERGSAHCARACARIETGDVGGATADLHAVAQISRLTKAQVEAVASLQALLLLRTEHYHEALRLARDHLQRRRHGSLPWCGVLLAVRYEAAHHLGQPQEAGTLSAGAAQLLRRHGHGPWLERLVTDYGLHIWSKHRT